MHQTLLTLHSVNRWLVLLSLLFTIAICWNGYRSRKKFSGFDNTVRHVTATISHVQLLLGLYLYMISPIVKFNVAEGEDAGLVSEHLFFRLIHISLMVVSVLIITIGSAKAKRAANDHLKFKTVLIWFSIALLIILIAIPWPFSPLVGRPYFRTF
ncbi:hypothetical protein MUK70_26115 [Dyadobacter chenwenxiniae]|uniref:Cytochrome B n=1 Tax=Dyadobacter chenwenxiniae TaxID=2906456 RepID=A0A9X1PPZ8_9BACT|nr:hypothetical protein [Dyadobacter chenwenxiniae]MCF0064294.1 hypothetical protein [Dyadobacter chenwenxiniae]UON82494.1 hypothetical protein MUK70_26115 [Dyadobacter chenwenxiniae]